jgi:hypothetical protein
MNGGTFTLEDGAALKNNDGNGVRMDGGTFTMSGGTISGNTGTNGEGGGVYINRPGSGIIFNMSGGEISGNTVNGEGGGVFMRVDSGGAFNMSGGVIKDNTAGNGGGVYVGGGGDNTFNMSGGAVVDSGNDVYLDGGKTITVTGNLTGASPVATITPDGTYSTSTQVLDGTAALLSANHTKFAVTPEAGALLPWFVDSNGCLTWTLVTSSSSSDLMVNFGIRPEGYAMSTITAANVQNTFSAIHSYLQNLVSPADLGGAGSPVNLGYYIDLPALNVAGYPTDAATAGYGKINILSNADVTPSPPPFADYEGAILRLIVVGINSFNEGQAGSYTGNGNGTTAHLVFQFQNLPVSRRMNATDTNAGGYKESEMRKYLVDVGGLGGNFSMGLQTAGVPVNTDIIWAPKRYMANAGAGASAADLIEDKIWLPTERELRGSRTCSHDTYETEVNQARLEYYADNGKRKKYLPGGTNGTQWWNSSTWSTKTDSFCCAWSDGSASADLSSSRPSYGCAPAFCVR